jgi:hypothetical protein
MIIYEKEKELANKNEKEIENKKVITRSKIM